MNMSFHIENAVQNVQHNRYTHTKVHICEITNSRKKRNIPKASKVREKISSPQMNNQNGRNYVVLLNSSTSCYKRNE